MNTTDHNIHQTIAQALTTELYCPSGGYYWNATNINHQHSISLQHPHHPGLTFLTIDLEPQYIRVIKTDTDNQFNYEDPHLLDNLNQYLHQQTKLLNNPNQHLHQQTRLLIYAKTPRP